MQAKAFDIWYVVLPRGPLTRLFKLCHWGEKGPQLEGMEVGGGFFSKKPLAMIWPRTIKLNREDGPEE